MISIICFVVNGKLWKLFHAVIIGLMLTTSLCRVGGLFIYPQSIVGTKSIRSELSSKQLAIQRWFAQLTILQHENYPLNDICEQWEGWGSISTLDDTTCDGNNCIRYEISGLSYAVAALAYQTPAYTELSEEILYNAIQRMLCKRTWEYIKVFQDFVDQPTYPDPVAYKNIMYSGHLAQMISLYESISGDFTFSTYGWNFTWGFDGASEDIDSEYRSRDPDRDQSNSTQGSGRYFPPIHYNTSRLMQAIFSETERYDIPGVPCEPDSIFVICNNFPMNAFTLHDATHGSTYAAAAGPLWQRTVENKGVNHLPDVEVGDVDGGVPVDYNFFNLDYLLRPLGVWEPVGSVGSDVWALAWMAPWWDFTRNVDTSGGIDIDMPEDIDTRDSAQHVLLDAYKRVLNSSRWVFSGETVVAENPHLLQESYSRRSDQDEHAYAYLHPGPLGNKIFPFTDAITTSFFPMLYKQFDHLVQDEPLRVASGKGLGDTSMGRTIGSTAGPLPVPSEESEFEGVFGRSGQELEQQVLWYFEQRMGCFLDSDGDGVRDSYFYDTTLPQTVDADAVEKAGAESGPSSGAGAESIRRKMRCGAREFTATTNREEEGEMGGSASRVAVDPRVSKQAQMPVGDYSVWATANLVLGMVLAEEAEEAEEKYGEGKGVGGSLRSMFSRPLFRSYPLGAAKLVSVEYPHVMVSRAVFNALLVPAAVGEAATSPSSPAAAQASLTNAAGAHSGQDGIGTPLLLLLGAAEDGEHPGGACAHELYVPPGTIAFTLVPGDNPPREPGTHHVRVEAGTLDCSTSRNTPTNNSFDGGDGRDSNKAIGGARAGIGAEWVPTARDLMIAEIQAEKCVSVTLDGLQYDDYTVQLQPSQRAASSPPFLLAPPSQAGRSRCGGGRGCKSVDREEGSPTPPLVLAIDINAPTWDYNHGTDEQMEKYELIYVVTFNC